MWDDEAKPRPKKTPEPRKFDGLDVDELKEYIDFLKSEISRAEGEISKRQYTHSAAESVFKKS